MDRTYIDGRQLRAAQDYAKSARAHLADSYQYLTRDATGREMTGEDLGLPLGQWAWEWLEERYLAQSMPEPYDLDKCEDCGVAVGELHHPWCPEQTGFDCDAPYAFWLGADANVNYCATHNNLYATVCRSCEP